MLAAASSPVLSRAVAGSLLPQLLRLTRREEILRLQRRTARGELAGPAIHIAGFIEGKSAYSSRNGFVVDSVEAGLAAVDWYAARGFRSIKLYSSVKPAWVKPIAARAHAQGMHVSGHVPAFMRAEEAVRAGYRFYSYGDCMLIGAGA